MVVAVSAVRVMQVSLDEIVDVLAMRHGVMAAVWPVLVFAGVGAAVMPGRARRWVRGVDVDRMLVDMIAVGVMQVTVVQVVDVTVVLDCGVPAVGAVSMLVLGMNGMF